jgi:aconitase B
MDRMRAYVRSDEAKAAARGGTLTMKTIGRALGLRLLHGGSTCSAGKILAEAGYLAVVDGKVRRYIERPKDGA